MVNSNGKKTIETLLYDKTGIVTGFELYMCYFIKLYYFYLSFCCAVLGTDIEILALPLIPKPLIIDL